MSCFPRSRLLFLVSLIAILIAGVLWLTRDGAQAHGVQVSSEPAASAQVADPPSIISVTFSEPIEPAVSTLQLYDQSANELAISPPRFFGDDPKRMAADVPTQLESGIYTVIWRNLSTVDGHTWAGSFSFIVLGPNGEVPEGAVPASLQRLGEPPSNRPSSLESVARWIVLLGTSVILGGTAYVLFVAHPASGRLGAESGEVIHHISRTVLLITSAIAAFLALEGSLLQLVVQADRLGGLGRADNILWDTRSGHYLLARQGLLIIALAAIAGAWLARSRRAQTAALGVLLVSSFGVLLTQSLVSHSAGSEGPFWTTTIDITHLAGAAVWIGMLTHVGLAMPRWLDELRGAPRTIFAAESFQRFSIVAAISVGVLMASGVLSALAQFTSWDDLWTYSYGWSLIAKMAALLPLLIVAGVNAFFLRSRVEAAALHIAGAAADDATREADAVARLQRLLSNTVRVEAILGIVVLVAAAVLIQLEPPRAAAEAERASAAAANEPIAPPTSDSIQRNAELEGLIVALKITPGKVGQNTFELGLGSEFGSVGEVTDTQLEFENVTANTGQSTLPLQLSGSAKFSAEGANLSLPGDWKLTATIRRRGMDDVQASFTIPVEAADAGAAAPTRSDSIWHWPFDGGRSIAAIVVLIATGAGGVTYAGRQIAHRRTAHRPA